VWQDATVEDAGTPSPQPERRIDAFRRTHLANERTYLSWLRSGLTAIAVGLGVAKFLPDLADAGAPWPYVILGIGFCVLGTLMMGAGVYRLRQVNRALERGEFGPLDERVATLIGAFTVVLAVATMGVILFDR
jgi:putative membrane protein